MPQVYSAWHKVVRLSLPNGWLATTKSKNAPQQLAILYKMATGDRRTEPHQQVDVEHQRRMIVG